jgi:hypothetical protein
MLRAFTGGSEMRNWLHHLMGGTLVYVIVAACEPYQALHGLSSRGSDASVGGNAATAQGGSQERMPASTYDSGPIGSGGAASHDASVADAMLDAVVNPVPTVRAQESGTRLKAKRLVTADGASSFVGWYDSQRNEDCGFGPAPDGATRCLPQTYVTAFLYADSGCSEPIYGINTEQLQDGCASLPAYIWSTSGGSPNACGIMEGGNRALRTLGAGTNPSTVYYATGANCTEYPQTIVDTMSFFALGAQIPMSSFVAADTQMDS